MKQLKAHTHSLNGNDLFMLEHALSVIISSNLQSLLIIIMLSVSKHLTSTST